MPTRQVKFALWPWEERAAEAGTRSWRSRHRRVSGEGLAFAQRKALPAQAQAGGRARGIASGLEEQLDHHGNQLLLDEIHEPGLLWQASVAREARESPSPEVVKLGYLFKGLAPQPRFSMRWSAEC